MPIKKLTGYGPSIVVLLTAGIVLVAGPRAVQSIQFAHTTARIDQASHRLAQDGNILAQINQAYRDIAAAVEPSVVHISAERPALPRASGVPARRGSRMAVSSGSGWIYDTEGHVVTNYHVVEGAERIDVQLYSGESRAAKIVGFDRTTDIAVLKIPPGRLHPAMRADIVGGRDEVRQGDLVFAFGSPFDFRFSMSSGVVSGKGRFVGVIREQTGALAGFENFIQVDAAINPGNSGGPLTDYRGHVIGMNTAIATAVPRTSQDGRIIDEGQFGGVGLAIPLEMIEPVVSQLIETGEVQKGRLGVRVVDRTASIGEELQAMGFSEMGVPVANVDPRAEALRGVLRPGDVITHVGRRPVGTVEELLSRAAPMDGRTIELTIWRYDDERQRSAPLAFRLSAEGAAALSDVSFLRYEDRIARRLEQLGFSGHGVPIVGVEDPGPALAAGLRTFDVITHINGQSVATRPQVQSMISSLRPEQVARVRVWRYEPESGKSKSLEMQVTLAHLDLARIAGILPSVGDDPERESLEELGIAKMATATPEKLRALDQTFERGVLIEEIVPGSRLEGRLEPGSVIVRVGNMQVNSVNEFLAALLIADVRGLGVPVTFRDPAGHFSTTRLEME